ncbi:hypothetical protein ACHAPF_000902 [Botrytis cinerea]
MTSDHLTYFGTNMELPSSATSIADAVDTGSKPEEIPKASETDDNGTSNVWRSWTPGSESVKEPLKTFHRKTKTGCRRCRTRRVKGAQISSGRPPRFAMSFQTPHANSDHRSSAMKANQVASNVNGMEWNASTNLLDPERFQRAPIRRTLLLKNYALDFPRPPKDVYENLLCFITTQPTRAEQ